jgi:zinc transporter ZupT
MRWIYLALILIFTLAGGAIPLRYRHLNKNIMVYLLAFTGAFLLGITLLHLAPESFQELGKEAGLYIILGFFLQVFLQRWSHGMEHGHSQSPVSGTQDQTGQITAAAALSLIIGLSVHGFMEGLPLGFTYRDPTILPSLSLGILLHKIPEGLTLMTMLLAIRADKKRNTGLLVMYSLVTPFAALIAFLLNKNFQFMNNILLYVIAIVTGAFLHISTTIFFESGTRHHELDRGKVISMIIGLGLSSLTLLIP